MKQYPRKAGRPLERPINRPVKNVLDPVIPFSWLAQHRYLSPAQAIAIYAVDELELNYADAARLINRDESTIRTGYHKGKEKQEAEKLRERKKRKPKKTEDSLTDE